MKCFRAPPAPRLAIDSYPVSEADSQRSVQRNPILMCQANEEPLPQRFAKARIVQEGSQTRYLAERPRGLAKGAFSNALQGSFLIGHDTDPEFVPGRRLVDNPNPPRPFRPTRKKLLQAYDTRDPIAQSDPSFEPEPIRPRSALNWRPSPITEYSNQKKCMLPAELGKQNPELYDKRNKSSVFSEQGEEAPAYGKKKIKDRQEEAPGLMQYRYALPYRDVKITEKPQGRRVEEDER